MSDNRKEKNSYVNVVGAYLITHVIGFCGGFRPQAATVRSRASARPRLLSEERNMVAKQSASSLRSSHYPLASSFNSKPAASSIVMELCNFCRGISVASIVPDEEGNAYIHHPTYSALEASAGACFLCFLIYTAFEEKNANVPPPPGVPPRTDYVKSDESIVWLLSSSYFAADPMILASGSGKGISGARVNIGAGTYFPNAVDLSISADPGE